MGDIKLKQSSNNENAGGSIRHSTRRRTTTEACSGQQEPSSVRKRKKSTNQNDVIHQKALQMIHELAKPLYKCKGLLDKILEITKRTKVHEAIQKICSNVDKALNVKNILFVFSNT